MTTVGDGAGLLRVSETLYRHLQARGGPDLLNVHAKWSPSAEITSKFEFQLQSGRNLSPATPSAPTFLMNPGHNSVLQGKKEGSGRVSSFKQLSVLLKGKRKRVRCR